MDPLYSAQDILLCDLCQTAALQSHCELCRINLCLHCVGKHLSDSAKKHNVVPYKYRTSAPIYPKCPNHTQKLCEIYCEECDIPVCSTCISSDKHHRHRLREILKYLNIKTKYLEKNLRELENKIYPACEDKISELESEKNNLEKQSEKLITAVTKRGEDFHREINIIVNRKKTEIDGMKAEALAVLDKRENEIKQITSEVRQCIIDLRKILESNDVSLTYAYQSRNDEFRQLPGKIEFSLPNFSYPVHTYNLNKEFGSLSCFSSSETTNLPLLKRTCIIHEPEILFATLDTGYDYLYSVTCLGDQEIWTCGDDKIMKLYNLDGKLLKSIQTKSGNNPCDITVTKNGDLVYTDCASRSVNIVKNNQIEDRIEEVVRLQGWKPYFVCSTSSGDLLVTMDSDDYKQSKVVRYSGPTEKQTIQFDSHGDSLYSSGYYTKYISENRNLDICVTDCEAHAVVVVNQAGKLRFRYTGHSSLIIGSFYPRGITTNSQSHILTADPNNDCIHILDQDGQFLRYFEHFDLNSPWGLCVDTKDNFFVAECLSAKVKKIKSKKSV